MCNRALDDVQHLVARSSSFSSCSGSTSMWRYGNVAAPMTTKISGFEYARLSRINQIILLYRDTCWSNPCISTPNNLVLTQTTIHTISYKTYIYIELLGESKLNGLARKEQKERERANERKSTAHSFTFCRTHRQCVYAYHHLVHPMFYVRKQCYLRFRWLVISSRVI